MLLLMFFRRVSSIVDTMELWEVVLIASKLLHTPTLIFPMGSHSCVSALEKEVRGEETPSGERARVPGTECGGGGANQHQGPSGKFQPHCLFGSESNADGEVT